MVDAEIRDGRRIAQLLASEVEGHEDPPLGRFAVADADRSAEGSPAGSYAYALRLDGDPVGEVYLHEDRARIELSAGVDAAADAAAGTALRVRPKAVRPPRLLAFVERGADVKDALPVLAAVARAVDDGDRSGG